MPCTILGIGDGHEVVVLRQTLKVGPCQQRDILVVDDGIAQMLLHFRLVEEVVVGPAEGARLADRAHVANHAVIGSDMKMTIGFTQIGQDLIDHVCRLEEPQHFMVDMNRAGQRMQRLLPLQHEYGEAVTGEEIGHEPPDRPAADYDYVILHVLTPPRVPKGPCADDRRA